MIDWVRFERLLRRQFRYPTLTVGDGHLLGNCGRPLHAHELLRACSNDPEEQEGLRWSDIWPAVPLEAIEQRYEPVKWFDFYWDSLGPMSWISILYLLRRGDRSSIIALLHEEQPLYLLGIVRPDDDPLLLSRLFTCIVENNGHGFGVDLFGSLPIETTNWRPELVPESVVKQAYWNWQEWCEQVEGAAWINLEETLASYELRTNPIERSLAAINGLPNLTEPDTLNDWLHERDAESAGLPDHSKQAILDWLFRRGYETR